MWMVWENSSHDKGKVENLPFIFYIGICNFKKGTVQSFKIWIDVKGSLKIMEKSFERLKRFLKAFYY